MKPQLVKEGEILVINHCTQAGIVLLHVAAIILNKDTVLEVEKVMAVHQMLSKSHQSPQTSQVAHHLGLRVSSNIQLSPTTKDLKAKEQASLI